jgi:hypothetical protein
MKATFFAALILFFGLPAFAQRVPANASSSSAVSNSSGGGGGGFGGGGAASGFASSTIHELAGNPMYQPKYDYAHGCGCDFSPSTFMSFEDAVKLGQSVLDEKPPSLGEVAAQYRAMKKQLHAASNR